MIKEQNEENGRLKA